VKKRGKVPGVRASGTAGTPREVSGAVHGIYFLEKMNRYPGPNKQSLPWTESSTWGTSLMLVKCKGRPVLHFSTAVSLVAGVVTNANPVAVMRSPLDSRL
jgi:hypothetical protein